MPPGGALLKSATENLPAQRVQVVRASPIRSSTHSSTAQQGDQDTGSVPPGGALLKSATEKQGDQDTGSVPPGGALLKSATENLPAQRVQVVRASPIRSSTHSSTAQQGDQDTGSVPPGGALLKSATENLPAQRVQVVRASPIRSSIDSSTAQGDQDTGSVPPGGALLKSATENLPAQRVQVVRASPIRSSIDSSTAQQGDQDMGSVPPGGALRKSANSNLPEQCVKIVRASPIRSSIHHSTAQQDTQDTGSVPQGGALLKSGDSGAGKGQGAEESAGQTISQRSKSFLRPLPVISPFATSDEPAGSEIADFDGKSIEPQAQSQALEELLPISVPFGSYNILSSWQAEDVSGSQSPRPSQQASAPEARVVIRPSPVPSAEHGSPDGDSNEGEDLTPQPRTALRRISERSSEGAISQASLLGKPFISPRMLALGFNQATTIPSLLQGGTPFDQMIVPAGNNSTDDEAAPKRLRGFLRPKEVPESPQSTASSAHAAKAAEALQSRRSQPFLDRQRRLREQPGDDSMGSDALTASSVKPAERRLRFGALPEPLNVRCRIFICAILPAMRLSNGSVTQI